MLAIKQFEARIQAVAEHHPAMPVDAVKLVRFALFLQRRVETCMAAIFASHGLSHSAWSLLMMIYSSPRRAISPSCASEALNQSRAHMTRITDELVRGGWVERVPQQGDRRAIDICLSEAAEARLRDALPAVWAEYEQMLACFDPDERALLGGLMRKWIAHLEDRIEALPDAGAQSAEAHHE
ncbi:MarR family transcriptional regulator [Nitrogeniibacter mangrovi]|uniref:MarR family transcriptional regulator n=1 Tax=Nitrogeniibacter mangrovi TaxID=2016596 RepID=A0A6C1B2U5_9RHOO|nr:MarR family transcriptional regulator [Nitrogeniibacter mangrovi]QID17971.1 MarR family transcriptional regulator [Nitrogeniibacter mangrovi]